MEKVGVEIGCKVKVGAMLNIIYSPRLGGWWEEAALAWQEVARV